MTERILTWSSSLRVRLIGTYVLVTVISFLFSLLLLMDPVEKFILKREEDMLGGIALTLGSTIRSPMEANEKDWDLDLKWTQRRCRRYLNYQLANVRIRVLDAKGRQLTDSQFTDSWDSWKIVRANRPRLAKRSEIVKAMHGFYGASMRDEAEDSDTPYTMYVAMPIFRTNPATGKQQVAFIMYLARPVESVRKNLAELRHWIEVSMLASLIMTIITGIVFSGHLSGGLRSAMQVARDFAAGKMARRMRATGRDEVGQLGAAFNQMADELQRHEQLRRDLLADVSHELRTPLTAISGCVDTLQDGALREDPAAAERFLGIIGKETERMQRLVNDILELSKLQAGVIAIPREPIPVRPLVEEAVEIARMSARQEGLVIRCEYCDDADPDELRVLGNEDRLAQALRNLLENARHHSPDGGAVTVTVEATPDVIIIRVRDEGEGIPAGDLPHVFDRFYRAGKNAKPGGNGLGLAIVREIMLAHEGVVAVDSIVGKGTIFSLQLPRVNEQLMNG
ncbi:MAG: sensor histidine kinase [Armatimonadota bacterium]